MRSLIFDFAWLLTVVLGLQPHARHARHARLGQRWGLNPSHVVRDGDVSDSQDVPDVSAHSVVVLEVSFDGTDFQGWADVSPRSGDQATASKAQQGTHLQRQKRAGPGAPRTVRTVQATLRSALERLHNGEGIELRGASRTDAGVHARRQVASYRSPTSKLVFGGDMQRLAFALNRMLPGDIRVTGATMASKAEFHATFDAREKRYRYAVDTQRLQDPLRRLFAWHRPLPRLPPQNGQSSQSETPGVVGWNLTAVRLAVSALEGKHDFSAFRGAPRGSARSKEPVSPLCTLRSVEILPLQPQGLGMMGPGAGPRDPEEAQAGAFGTGSWEFVFTGDRFV